MEENKQENNVVENADAKPAKKSKKKIILTVIGCIFAVILLALIFIPGTVVKHVVPPIASQLLKVKVEIGSCFINIFDGAVHIKNMKVHNPAGYDAPYAFELGNFYVDVKMLTLASPKIEISDIVIEDMHATFEMKLGTNNLQDISNNLPKPAENAKKKKKNKETKESPQMVIRHFKIAKSDFTMLKVPWPIPSVELTDVGDGKTITEFVAVVYDAVFEAVIKASKTVSDGVITVGKGVGKSAESATKAVLEGTNNVVKSADKVLDEAGKSIKNIFKK